MAKDLFKWTPMTEDLRPSRKPGKRIKKAQTRKKVEAWMSSADKNVSLNNSVVDQFGPDHQTDQQSNNHDTNEDDIDIWLRKVRKAADVAESDVINDYAAESAHHPHTKGVPDSDVSSMFAQIISDYIPNYDDKEDHNTSEEPTSASTLPLNDRYDAVTEAKSILNTWLQKKTEINHEEFLFGDEKYEVMGTVSPSSKHDLTSELLDCEEDDVAIALQRLRSAPVEQKVIKKLTAVKKVKNPALSIAARQEQAKERRRKMEEERSQKLKEAAERKAARAAAEIALQEERSRKEREEKLEEDKIQVEMVALRKKIREEQQEKLVIYEKKKEKQTESYKAELAAEYRQVVMQNAEEEVKRKRILATRHILLKQLQEAERKEMKERYSMLQRTFTKWREATLDGRVIYNKAVALHEWKSQVRAWRQWRSYCRLKQEKRDEKVREAMFRENKKVRIADVHYQKSHLRYYFKYWQYWHRTRVQEKREEKDDLRRKQLMEQCLAAAVEVSRNTSATTNASVTRNASATKDDCPKIPNNPTMKPNYDGAKYSKKKKLGINFAGRGSKSGNNNVEAQENTERVGVERESIMAARKDVLHKSGPVSVPVHNPWDSPVRPLISSNNSRTVGIDKAKENKIPVALRGMEERARQRAMRRQEIENRKVEKKQEAERFKIEEEKRRAEEEEQKRQVEKEQRLKEIAEARERERARLQEIQAMKDKTLTAINHYHVKLKVKYVLNPLKRLCQKLKDEEGEAARHYDTTCVASHWKVWKQHLEIKIIEKEERATQFYRNLILRQTLRSMKRALTLQESYQRISDRHYSRSLRVRVLWSWQEGAKTCVEERGGLEIRAVQLDRKITLRNHLLFWHRLTPQLVREREADVRKNRMRSMVAELLPDFAPSGSY
ncbi:coiled-coil domain-containing protein 191-like isoform X2 [Bolinopsis microptera]|uniref:coiled-coil domain-containing protein 191-like isoform X2 n=1 Tax=Bolinopsis microptera TaxID=2820187 RepID=UPI0030795E8A